MAVCSLDPLRTVPASFLGISTEDWALPLFEQHGQLLARVLSLLHVPGGGPLILRVGGTSAEQTFWLPSAHGLPRWVFAVTPSWFARTRRLIEQTGARVILDLNTLTGTLPGAVRFVRAAVGRLPRGSIIGLEVGNESDLYVRRYWQTKSARSWPGASDPPARISAAGYAEEFRRYARALRKVAPGIPLIGPALGNSVLDAGWIRTLLAGPHPGLGIVSGHWYPYSACVRPGSPSYPTIAKLLGENAAAGMARGLAPVVGLVHQLGLQFRLTELNSITCGGLRGVSNTFATALWAPDALMQLLAAGVDGISVHVREDAINGAFALRRFGLLARPLLYGMILLDRTLGPGAQLLPVRVSADPALRLEVWAVRLAGDVLHVLVIDKGNRSARLDLLLPATGAATVQRLLAPSPSARTGVTFDGQRLGADARWRGHPTGETLRPGDRGYELTVRGFSAALLSVRLAPST